MQCDEAPALYGLTKANSSRHGTALWGKNQFNSTFPVALCLFMRDMGVKPLAVTVGSDGRIDAHDGPWNMAEIVGAEEEQPFYHFEKAFEPYAALSRNVVDHIDLVVTLRGKDRIPLEMKMTVVPDSGTAGRERHQWGPEMVLRPVSSAHAMMGVASSLLENKHTAIRQDVVALLRPAYNGISDWNNVSEIASNAKRLRVALADVVRTVRHIQAPFLVQPIWKTEGQSPILSKRCFDVFVWSDVAVLQIPVDMSVNPRSSVSRHLREVARHVRALYDVLTVGDYDYQAIYGGMPLGNQTDKSFALAGRVTRAYIGHYRLLQPEVTRDMLEKIVLNGGEYELRPERRFDAAVVAHMRQ